MDQFGSPYIREWVCMFVKSMVNTKGGAERVECMSGLKVIGPCECVLAPILVSACGPVSSILPLSRFWPAHPRSRGRGSQ